MQNNHLPDDREWLERIRHWRNFNIEESRKHLHHMFVLAGALAALLTPAYASDKLSLFQHICVAHALICFLTSIGVGFLYLTSSLGREAKILSDMEIALEEGRRSDAEAIHSKYKSRRKKKWDLVSLVTIGCFASGVLFLISGVVIGEYL